MRTSRGHRAVSRARGRRGPGGARAALAAGLFLLAALTACASTARDVHLSPLYSRLAMAGGGLETEALAGAVRVRRPAPGLPAREWMLRPLVGHHVYGERDTLSRFLVPLGMRRVRESEHVLQLLPVARYQKNVDEHGHDQWKLFMLPGIFFSEDAHGHRARAFFPFYGVIENYFTYDRISFVLFPLFMKNERDGRTKWHFLWPVFNYSSGGGGGTSFRVWPLFGRANPKGYDRRFFLWPLFHFQREGLLRPEEQHGTRWMVFPFFGRTERGPYRAWTVLWPFFGWARHETSGYRSYAFPWPLVLVQRPGKSDAAHRTRLWPFWSHYVGDGLDSIWAPFPLINVRRETYPESRRRGENVIPFWQRWVDTDNLGERTGTWQKLWPLYQHRREDGEERLAFPALNPLWYTPVIDEHYGWIYELYTRERDGERVRERSWGGIWRSERDARERRTYLSLLWSGRRVQTGEGTVHEASFLLGLLRWRRGPDGFRLLAPAPPGPGWPAEWTGAGEPAP